MMRFGRKYSNHIMLAIGIVIVAIYLFPFVWMVLTSFKSQAEIFQVPPTFFPNEWRIDSYIANLSNMRLFLTNSFIIAGGAAGLSILLAVPCAYGLARFNIKGRAFFLLVFLASQLLPATVLLTPLFLMFNRLDLLNTHLAPILTTSLAGIPFSVLMLRPFFMDIPKELEEAAAIDGCGRIQTFVKIIMPVSLSSVAVCLAISFFFAWGDLIYSVTFNRNQDLWPMTAGVHNAIGRYGIIWDMLMAFATVTALPVIVIFIVLQKHIVKGLTSGAVKS